MMEGLDESAVEHPPPHHPPPNHPHSSPPISSIRLHTSADLLLPATFLAITIVGILFVLLILIIWIRSHLASSKLVKSSKDVHYLSSLDDGVQHFGVIIDSSEEQMDEFQFKLPSDIKYIDEEVGGNVNPLLVNMKQSGGSSPKCPEDPSDKNGDDKESTQSTPSSASKSKSDTKFVFPPSEDGASTSKGKVSKFKVALPEQQWILHRKPPLDFRGYSINIPKNLGLLDSIKTDMDVDSKSSDEPKKFNATRSPSLEKDDKSPIVSSQKDIPVMFGFGCDASQSSVVQKVVQESGKRSGNASPIVEVRVQPLSTDSHCSFVDKRDVQHAHKSDTCQCDDLKQEKAVQEKESVRTVISRRFGTCNNGLRINTNNDNLNQTTEKLEMQNSPRSFDPVIGKENNPSPRFSYSPKFFATPDSKSPKFFGTPDQKSPKFFATPDPKSPAFFADAQSRTSSPRTFDKANSPRLTSTSSFKSVQSPLIMSNASGECFQFDKSELMKCGESVSQDEVDSVFINKKSLQSALEQPVPDDVILNNNVVRQGSLLDTGQTNPGGSVESDCKENLIQVQQPDISNSECDITNDNTTSNKVVNPDNLVVPSTNSGANYRRQRLKSISLDSDNAKFIEQNLGVPMVKHLKQENLYDLDDREKGSDSDISSPKVLPQHSYFKFDNIQSHANNNGNEHWFPDISTTDTNDMRTSPDNGSPKYLRETSSALAFTEMQPRFSPKEFDELDVEVIKSNKNIRNLTIDINKRDEELVKELRECSDHLDSGEKRLTPKTPTLKVKATSLDSSEPLNLSLPQSNTLQVPQNSISVPNTPKKHLKRTISHKINTLLKSGHYNIGNYSANLNELTPRSNAEAAHQRKLLMNVKCPLNYVDSGIFLRENHANLMLFQASKHPIGRGFNSNSSFSCKLGSFDENMVDLSESTNQVSMQKEMSENRLSLPLKPCDNSLLGSNLLGFKQNLSVSSTNLKTLPEGVPSNDFDTQSNDGKPSKKTLLQRRGSNQSLTINLDTGNTSLKYSTLSLQGSNLSLASFGASSHNLANIKNSASNFSLNTDNRQKKNIFERRNSNTSLTSGLEYVSQQPKHSAKSHYSLNDPTGSQSGKKCLLQRRGSNTSLTLNLQGSSNTNLNRCTSNSSSNIQNDGKPGRKKGLLERRSSNTSLTLNICGNSHQMDNNRVLSVSNYNLDCSANSLSHCNSNQSINNPGEQKKGLLERRNSNTSLTLHLNNYLIHSDAMRYVEIDDVEVSNNYDCKNTSVSQSGQSKEKHRKSLSTENLIPKSYKSRCRNVDSSYSFGSHDNLCSFSYSTDNCAEPAGNNNLTYVCGDQENEMIYAFGCRQHIEQISVQNSIEGPIRSITTKPLSPHSTSEDFKTYLANIQHLQNASNVLTRQQLKDLNCVFQEGYSKSECPLERKSPSDLLTSQLSHLLLTNSQEGESNPQRLLPEPISSSLEYQKSLLRNLHQEFWDLPTNFQEKPMVFGSHPKNRYKTILPNEHSRVILRPEVGQAEEGYINANYIKGHEFSKNCYIATQGPLQNTIYDFWLMVYQNSFQFYNDGCTKTNEDRHFGSPQAKSKRNENNKTTPEEQVGIQKIVMLTNLIENGRQKCEKYFPIDLNEEMEFYDPTLADYPTSGAGCNDERLSSPGNIDSNTNSFKVKNLGIMHKTGYTIRKILVEYKNVSLMKSGETNTTESLCIQREPHSTREKFEILVDEPEKTAGETPKRGEGLSHSLIVYHYWFDSWADHKCPKDVTALLDLSISVMQNQILNFEEDITDVSKKAAGFHPRSEFIALRAKSFDKTEHCVPYKYGLDKSCTNLDFTVYSKEKSDSLKSSNLDIDNMEGVPRERRLSSFQLAKAFFDEASKACSSDNSRDKLRKNSLASRLDIPKRVEQTRRESTGRIDSKYIPTDSLSESVKTLKPAATNTSQVKLCQGLREMPPIIVHCSAGIGRTGCLIAIINGIRQLKADQRVDILSIVCNMRLNRGGMVQNSEQYELIHKVLGLYEHLGIPDFD